MLGPYVIEIFEGKKCRTVIHKSFLELYGSHSAVKNMLIFVIMSKPITFCVVPSILN